MDGLRLGRWLTPALLLAALLLLTPSAPARAQNVLSAQQWRDDLHYLDAQIRKTHPNPFHHVREQDFDTAVATLDAKIPTLSDYEVEVELARIVALLGEGHSRLSLPGLPDPMSDVPEITPFKDPRLAFHRLPIRLYAFSDGLFVVAAMPAYRSLIGAQVLRIADQSDSVALDAVRPIVNRDNDMGLRLIAPDLVMTPEVLSALHLTETSGPVALTVRLANGAEQRVALTPMETGLEPAWAQAPTRGASELSNGHPDRNLWAEYQPASKTLFAKINVIQDSPTQTVAQFAREIDALSVAGPIDRFVIDLRGCHGGDNQKFRALLLEVVRNARLDRSGEVFVLIDRGTFSAAVNSATDLERLANAIFVGEPTAGAPSSWGDPRKIVLPNSGLIVRISSVYWRDWTSDESRPAVAPDIATPVASADYFMGRDPALTAVEAFPARPAFDTLLASLARSGAGMRTVLRLYYQHKTDPLLADDPTQRALQRAGEAYLARKDVADAQLAFAINFHDDPATLSSALAAVEATRKSDPDNADLTALQAKLEALRGQAR